MSPHPKFTHGESQSLLPLGTPARTAHSNSAPALTNEIYGYFSMSIATIWFSGMTAIVHILGSASYSFGVPSLHIVWFRAVIQLTLAAIYVILFVDFRSHISSCTRHVLLLLIVRGIVGTICFLCFSKSLALLPLGDAVTIFFLGPIFTLIITTQTLGERVSPLEWSLSLASFLGVALISRPFLSSSAVPHHAFGIIIAIIGAALSAGSYTVVRSLAHRIHFMIIVMSLGLCGFIVTTVLLWPSLAASLRRYSESNATLPLLLLQGCFSFFGQCFLSNALQYGGGLSVMLLNLDAPIACAIGIGLGEVPSWQAGVGSAMVIAASATISFRRAIQART